MIIRTDIIGPRREMQMWLMRRRGSYFVKATHEAMPGLIGFRRINCEDQEQAARSYLRSVEVSTTELMSAGDSA
jgi:hypothetical protein